MQKSTHCFISKAFLLVNSQLLEFEGLYFCGWPILESEFPKLSLVKSKPFLSVKIGKHFIFPRFIKPFLFWSIAIAFSAVMAGVVKCAAGYTAAQHTRTSIGKNADLMENSWDFMVEPGISNIL